jgi:hypothetical protein
VVQEHDAAQSPATLQVVRGSLSDDWNNILVNQAMSALSVKNSDAATIRKQRDATIDALFDRSCVKGLQRRPK